MANRTFFYVLIVAVFLPIAFWLAPSDSRPALNEFKLSKGQTLCFHLLEHFFRTKKTSISTGCYAEYSEYGSLCFISGNINRLL